MGEHLKCPFCGDVGVVGTVEDGTGGEGFSPFCCDCGVGPTEVFPTPEAALEWWDTRAEGKERAMCKWFEDVKLPVLCHCGSLTGAPTYIVDAVGLQIRIICSRCGAPGPRVTVDLKPAVSEAVECYSAMFFDDADFEKRSREEESNGRP